jgi:hypothetical protein
MTEQDTPVPPEPAETDQQVTDLARQALAGLQQFRPTEELTAWERLEHENFRSDIENRKKYADRMLKLLVAELVFVNGMFFLYTWLGVHWNVPGTTMQVWLSSTVVQIVGIVYVVARYLFPRRDYRN